MHRRVTVSVDRLVKLMDGYRKIVIPHGARVGVLRAVVKICVNLGIQILLLHVTSHNRVVGFARAHAQRFPACTMWVNSSVVAVLHTKQATSCVTVRSWCYPSHVGCRGVI